MLVEFLDTQRTVKRSQEQEVKKRPAGISEILVLNKNQYVYRRLKLVNYDGGFLMLWEWACGCVWRIVSLVWGLNCVFVSLKVNNWPQTL